MQFGVAATIGLALGSVGVWLLSASAPTSLTSVDGRDAGPADDRAASGPASPSCGRSPCSAVPFRDLLAVSAPLTSPDPARRHLLSRAVAFVSRGGASPCYWPYPAGRDVWVCLRSAPPAVAVSAFPAGPRDRCLHRAVSVAVRSRVRRGLAGSSPRSPPPAVLVSSRLRSPPRDGRRRARPSASPAAPCWVARAPHLSRGGPPSLAFAFDPPHPPPPLTSARATYALSRASLASRAHLPSRGSCDPASPSPHAHTATLTFHLSADVGALFASRARLGICAPPRRCLASVRYTFLSAVLALRPRVRPPLSGSPVLRRARPLRVHLFTLPPSPSSVHTRAPAHQRIRRHAGRHYQPGRQVSHLSVRGGSDNRSACRVDRGRGASNRGLESAGGLSPSRIAIGTVTLLTRSRESVSCSGAGAGLAVGRTRKGHRLQSDLHFVRRKPAAVTRRNPAGLLTRPDRQRYLAHGDGEVGTWRRRAPHWYLLLVLRVADVLHPIDGPAVEPFLDSGVRHRRSRRGAVPMLLTRRDPDHVARSDLLETASSCVVTICRGRLRYSRGRRPDEIRNQRDLTCRSL